MLFNLFTPLTNVTLHALIAASLGHYIPNKAVCDGHSAPFDFVADSFFERVNDCLVIGPRNGGKTLNFAILEFLEAVQKNGCQSCHLGAIMSQAKRAYGYVAKWSHQYKDSLGIKTCTREKTILGNNSEIEIVPGTVNGVNSPHPHKAQIDEFELLNWEIFQEAISMPKSDEYIGAALRLATTRKYPSGNAQKMIDEHQERGFKLYKWCVFEILEKCTGSCADCKKYISYNRDGEAITWYEKCQGKAKRANGYFKISDVIKKFLTLDYETFEAQWLCERPERTDCVFPEFHFNMNVIEEWKFDPALPCGRGWDFGFDDPTAVLYFQWDDMKNCYLFDEHIVSGSLIDDIANETRAKSDLLANHNKWEDWGDPSGKARTGVDSNSYMTKLGNKQIYVQSQYSHVADGIQAVKKKLRKSSFTGKPQLYITKNCKKTIKALELAQWDRTKGEAVHSREKYKHDEHSHPLDALRYFILGIFPDFEMSFG